MAKRVLLFIISLVLIAGMGTFVGLKVHKMQNTQDQLNAQAQAEAQQEAAVTSTPTPTPTEAVTSASSVTETPTPTPTETPTPTPEAVAAGISIRGDSFDTDDADQSIGYPAKLQTILKDNGYDYTVEDNTWNMSGSLSQMALAGVSDEDIQNFISGHADKMAALGVEGSATETTVRDDLDQYKKDRDDLNYIPVICIGYYGGWGYDVSELVEQEKKILATYTNQDKYIICGFYPDNSVVSINTDDYDNAQISAFGDHYINLSLHIDEAAYSEAGHEQMAQAIYQKLSNLGYLDANATAPAESSSDTTQSTEGQTATENTDATAA